MSDKLQDIHDDVIAIKTQLAGFNPQAIKAIQGVHTKILVALISAIIGVYAYVRTLHPPAIARPAPIETVTDAG